MKANILLIAAFIMALSVNGCAANNAKGGNESIYDRPGMEISKTASQMADTLCETFKHDLEAKARSDHSEFKNFPIVGVTSFVDTDTYENAGHLGRSLGEFFIHELDRRGIPVAEFKTTGSLSITEDGEVDHRIPESQGGKSEMGNLQWLCREPCHADKTELESAIAQGRVVKSRIGSDGWPIK